MKLIKDSSAERDGQFPPPDFYYAPSPQSQMRLPAFKFEPRKCLPAHLTIIRFTHESLPPVSNAERDPHTSRISMTPAPMIEFEPYPIYVGYSRRRRLRRTRGMRNRPPMRPVSYDPVRTTNIPDAPTISRAL